jgi:hypothetical protein
VMAALVQALRAGTRPPVVESANRVRVLDERHFEFRGRLSAGAQDDQRRSRQEDRRDRRESGEEPA